MRRVLKGVAYVCLALLILVTLVLNLIHSVADAVDGRSLYYATKTPRRVGAEPELTMLFRHMDSIVIPEHFPYEVKVIPELSFGHAGERFIKEPDPEKPRKYKRELRYFPSGGITYVVGDVYYSFELDGALTFDGASRKVTDLQGKANWEDLALGDAEQKQAIQELRAFLEPLLQEGIRQQTDNQAWDYQALFDKVYARRFR